MATLRVLTFNLEGRPIQFNTWLDDLQLGTRSQWLTRDAAVRLAVRNHLSLGERSHFGQHKIAKALYDAVVACYSSPATAALDRLILPYPFPELSAFTTVEDLIIHLRTSNTRYGAALKAEFLDKNPHLMYITLYFIVTRLPDSLPTDLTVNLLKKHLLVAETSIVVVGAARDTPRTPFFEGCSPSPLAPSYTSAAAVDILGTEEVGAASAPSAKRRSGKGKGGKSGGGGCGGGGGGGSGGGGGGGGGSGSGGGSGAFGGGGGGSGGSGGGGGGGSGSGGGGNGGGRGGAVYRGVSGGGQRHAEGECYLYVPPDPGIDAVALGASESALPDTAPAEALHTFTFDSDWLTPQDAQFLHVPPLFSKVRHFRPAHSQVFTSPRSLQTWSGSSPLLVSPPVAPDSPLAPPPWSPLPATPSWHALPPPCFWSSQVSVPPPALACPALPCVEGRQRAAPHSSLFPPTTAPLQTLHMDVWGPARISGQGRERYFRLVVDDYTRYTTVFPLRNKGQVPDVFIPWIRADHLHLREQLLKDLPNLTEVVARTSMIHAAAPHFLWPFAVRYAAHQLNLWPRVSLLETSPTMRWTGKVGDALVFRVWGSRALVCDTSVDRLSSRAIPCVFLGFPHDAPGWQFYHPTLRRVLPSQDVTFDESVSFYRLFPYRTAPLPPFGSFCVPYRALLSDRCLHSVWTSRLTSRFPFTVSSPTALPLSPPPPLLFLAPGPPPVDPIPPQSPAPSSVSQGDPLPLAEPVEVTVDSGAAGGGASRGAASGGAEPEGAYHGDAETDGAEPKGAESEGAESGGAEPRGTTSAEGPAGVLPRQSRRREPLSPQQLRERFARRTRLRSGTAGAGGPTAGGIGAGGAGATRPGGAGVTTRAGGTGGAGAAGPGGARTRDPGAGASGAGGPEAGDPGVGGAGAGGAGNGGTGAGDPGAGGTGAGDPRVGGAGAGGVGAGGAGAGGAGAGGAGVGGAGAGGAGARGTRAGGAGDGDPRARGAGTGVAKAGGTGAGGTVQQRLFFVPPPPSSLPPPGSVLCQVLSLPSSTGLTPRLLCPPPCQS
ncbi:unnamed protein product [Closterium sp. NIES-53]